MSAVVLIVCPRVEKRGLVREPVPRVALKVAPHPAGLDVLAVLALLLLWLLRRVRIPPRVIDVAALLLRLLALLAAEPLAVLLPAVPGDLVHLGGGVAQAGADLVHLQLDDGPLLALARLERALPQPTGHEHAGASDQGLRHVLRDLPPDAAPQEQRVPVLPLPAGLVERAGGAGHGEAGHRHAGLGELQFRIGGQVAHHGDDRFTGHWSAPRSWR